VGITKHAENDVANGFLRLDELAFKEIDQRRARAGVECVTEQLDDAAPVHVCIMTTTTGSAEDLMRPCSRAPRGRRDVAEGLERPRRCPRFFDGETAQMLLGAPDAIGPTDSRSAAGLRHDRMSTASAGVGFVPDCDVACDEFIGLSQGLVVLPGACSQGPTQLWLAVLRTIL